MTHHSKARNVVAAFVMAGLLACGKKGDPLPPVRVLPQAVGGVKLAQSGNVVRLSYQVPRAMTDGSAPPVLDIELLQAVGPGDFAKVAKKTVTQAAPGEVIVEEFQLPAPMTPVRVSLRASARDRYSTPSTVITLVAREPVEIPASLCAEPAPEGGIHVEWSPIAPPPSPPPGTPAASGVVPSPPRSPSPTAGTPSPLPASPSPSAGPGASPHPSPKPTPLPPVTYRLFRRDEKGPYGPALNTTPIPGTNHEDPLAPTETTSCYVVRAAVSVEPLVESADSNEICVRLEDTVPPATPSGVAAFVRDRNVEVVWDAVSAPDLAGYRVKRSQAGGPPALLKDLDGATTSFSDMTAEPGVVYQYIVVAFDKAGNESAPSPPAQAGTQ